jgi:hypothetical protein
VCILAMQMQRPSIILKHFNFYVMMKAAFIEKEILFVQRNEFRVLFPNNLFIEFALHVG